uniref:Uncharacterized protein n=1 Tax=Octactis speculum TaxID=3111310 RepID=A0A7S2HKZ4_9STRA|mmetsp:Transcript_7247/g.8939  ORF Transcript_7247/g.8939 Transcript_7247/m.8939 type:complete len:260 (+) Transcript_7247:89-868(+)
MTRDPLARPPSPPRPSQAESLAVKKKKKKRPISSVLGIAHYGSDDDSDDNTQDDATGADDFNSSQVKRRRVRFADPELLTTVITYDNAEPIDPDAAVEDAEMEDTAASVTVADPNTWFLGAVQQQLAEEQERLQREQKDEQEFTPSSGRSATFSFAKTVTTSTKRAVHTTTVTSGKTGGGQWALLTDTAKADLKSMEWFCDLCLGTIEADETRYDCRECATEEWCCCVDCLPASQKHPINLHPLEPTTSNTHLSVLSAN